MAITFRGVATALVVGGNDSLEQNLFLIESGVRSRVNVIVKKLSMQNDPVIVLATVMPQVKTSRVVGASNATGISLVKGKFDSSQVSDENVKIWSSSLHSPLVVNEGGTVWQHYGIRLHTAIGQILSSDDNLLTPVFENENDDFIIPPGNSLLVQVVSSAVATNASATNNWFIQVVWEEEPIATFSISGVVTLGSSPVAGAKVMVLQADDDLLTNAVLWEVKTTGVDGAWSSSILTGKVGAVFVQYKDGGTLYTANGSPFLEQ